MKLSSKAKKLAKEIFSTCLIGNKVSSERVSKFVTILKASDETLATEILVSLQNQIKVFESSQTLTLETSDDLDQSQVEEAKRSFETLMSRKLQVEASKNPELIAGLRARVGDFVWENSVRSNLEVLKGTLKNE